MGWMLTLQFFGESLSCGMKLERAQTAWSCGASAKLCQESQLTLTRISGSQA